MATHQRVGKFITTDIERAADAISAGGLVAIPTETVYGLAADASNAQAVQRIFEVKGRPADHPLIVHLPNRGQISHWSAEVSQAAKTLTAAAWPGPLTVILPRRADVLDEVTGGLDTVGLRVPAHHITSQLLQLTGSGLAAPSANRYGSISPTTAGHVHDELAAFLDPATDLILDGGPCALGIESTIVDCTIDPAQILRAGGIPAEDVERLLAGQLTGTAGPARASGMRESHYAPRCEVKLADNAVDAIALQAATPNSEILDLSGDLVAYAHELYDRLRHADQRGVATIVAVLPGPEGLGLAIRDRLTKAAAPRSR